jgi:CrcB protein
LTQVLLVFLGGGIGAALRHGVNIGSARMFGTAFPWHTLIVNVVGSLIMGLLTAWFAFRTDWWTTQHARLFLTTGILGGFTTFSTFSLDTALLWERGATFGAAAYVILSLILSVGALFVAMWLVRSAS